MRERCIDNALESLGYDLEKTEIADSYMTY